MSDTLSFLYRAKHFPYTVFIPTWGYISGNKVRITLLQGPTLFRICSMSPVLLLYPAGREKYKKGTGEIKERGCLQGDTTCYFQVDKGKMQSVTIFEFRHFNTTFVHQYNT